MLYINDFEKTLRKFKPNMFTDDTNVYMDDKDVCQLLEDQRNEKQNTKDWLRQNELK